MGTAAGTVVLRTLKKFDEKTILWYSYWVSLLFTLPVVYTVGKGMSIFLEFNYFDWGLMVGTALAKMAMLLCKIKALQMQSAAKLQILSPVQTVITFVGQIALFHQDFNAFQNWMLGGIFLLYVVEGIYVVFYQ